MCKILERLLDCVHRPIRIVPFPGPVSEQLGPVVKTPQYQRPCRKGLLIMGFSMSDSQLMNLKVKFVDKKNNPAPVDGVPEWSVDNSEMLALTPAADGLSCVVSAVGPLGAANVTVKADADLGSGVTAIIGTAEIQITGGTATTISIDADAPTEQP